MQLAIIAGGQGTRLKERLGDLPKPMAPIAGRPLVEHQMELARRHGIEDIVLLVGHGARYIEEFLGDGSRWGARLRYVHEPAPLGTAGAVLAALDALGDRFLVMYGDTMLNVDLDRFCEAHARQGAGASLLVHPNNHPHDSDLVETDEGGRIAAFHPYPHPPDRYYQNLVNAALYVVERRALEPYGPPAGALDFGKHLFPRMLGAGEFLYGYRSPEYIKDAGTPERLDQVMADYESGRIARGSFATPAPAVFLDRDGTLNLEVNRVKTVEQLEVLEGVGEAIGRLNRSPYRAVVITNQPVIARGDCSEQTLRAIHNKLETMLGRSHAYLDGLYYCPHHPERGHPGERVELKIACDCRKPAIGLIRQAQRELNLDLARSWFIGDSTVDLQTAANAGVRSILVETGYQGQDARHPARPDRVCADLGAAVEFLLGAEPGS